MRISEQFYEFDNDTNLDGSNLNYNDKTSYDNTNSEIESEVDSKLDNKLESTSDSESDSDSISDNNINLNQIVKKFTSDEIKKIAEINPTTPIDSELVKTISKLQLDKKTKQTINKRVAYKEPISRETIRNIQEKAILTNSNILNNNIAESIISLDPNVFIKKDQLNIILSKIPLNDQDRDDLLISYNTNFYPSLTFINNILKTSFRMNDNLTDDDINNLLKLRSKMKISETIMNTLNKLTLNIDDKKEIKKKVLTDKLIKNIQKAAISPISSNIIPDVADTISKLNLSTPINQHDANLIINNLPLKDKISKKIIESSNKNKTISKNIFINILKTALETANKVGKNTINTIIGAKTNNLSPSDQNEIINKLNLDSIKENFTNFDSLLSFVTKKAINPNDEVSHETLEAIKNIDNKLTPKQTLLILNNTNIDDNTKNQLASNCNNNEIPSKDTIRTVVENAIQYNGQIRPDVKKAVSKLITNKSKPLNPEIANKLIELPVSDTVKKEIIKCSDDCKTLPNDTLNNIIDTAIKPSIAKPASVSEIVSKLPMTEYITDKEVDILSRKLPMTDQMKNNLKENINKPLTSDIVNNLLQTSIKFEPIKEKESGMPINVFIKLFEDKYNRPLNQDQLAIIEKKENKNLTNDDINLILQYNNIINKMQYYEQLINQLQFNKKTKGKLIKRLKNKSLTDSDLKKIKKGIKKYKSNHKLDNQSIDTNNSIQQLPSSKIRGRSIDNRKIKRLEKIIKNVNHEKQGLNKILKDINIVENFENNKPNIFINLFRFIIGLIMIYIVVRCFIIFYKDNFKLSNGKQFFKTIKGDMLSDLNKLKKTTTCIKHIWI
jgi:hypothetical protein